MRIAQTEMLSFFELGMERKEKMWYIGRRRKNREENDMELILIRHGETAWNPEGRFQGSTDMELSEIGKEQARLVGERLKNRKIDRIIASPMKRARDTAAAVAGHHGLTVETEERLREVDFGEWEGKNGKELREESDLHIDYYFKDRDFYGFPGEGSLANARYRVGSFLDELKWKYWETDETIVLVGHGAIFRMAIFHLLDIGNIYYSRMVPENTGITRFKISKQKGLQMICYNDTAHLEKMTEK